MLNNAARDNWHLVCYECAKKHSLLDSYFGSWLRTLDNQTGCMLCGKVASLAEIHVPPEIKEASRHIAQQPQPETVISKYPCGPHMIHCTQIGCDDCMDNPINQHPPI